MKTNFEIKKNKENDTDKNQDSVIVDKKDLTEAEFEEFIRRSGAAGSFMIFRSEKKEDELGFDNL